MKAILFAVAALAVLTSAARAQTADQSGAQGAETGSGRAAPTASGATAEGQGGAASKAGMRSRGGARKSRLTTSDTAMNTGDSGASVTPTGPETTTPDAQGTSDLTGSTGASIPLGAAPAPPSPAPPGGAPSGGAGPH